ncbi:MAG: peptidylprolyl isomerase [Candidatus Margulisbacteria bacterium]|nr:peptidylprolyl isomerase [Candidatus Margulisiibacteriota bacterium]
MSVKNNDNIKVHYTGKLEDGTVFDSSEGREPLAFKVGVGHVIQGFDEGVLGMKVAEKKEIFIPMEKAYGKYSEDLIVSFLKEQLPEDMDFEVGLKLQMPSEHGMMIPITVKEVTDKEVFLDANSDLAGKNLIFDVQLVEIM